MKLQIGDQAPEFVLADQTGKLHDLKSFSGQWVLLYFYPKDDTPGCTTEACSIRDQWEAFTKAGITVLGVSADSIKSHQKFSNKYKLPFILLADDVKKVVKAYGAYGKKKFLGREYMGINRISFLINPKGKISKMYEKVKPAEHAEQVLKDVKELSV